MPILGSNVASLNARKKLRQPSGITKGIIATCLVLYPMEDVHVSPADGDVAWDLALILLHHLYAIEVVNDLCVLFYVIPLELNSPTLVLFNYPQSP